MSGRRRKPARTGGAAALRAAGYRRVGRLDFYLTASPRLLNASISPATHATWIAAIDAGKAPCLRCGRTLTTDLTEGFPLMIAHVAAPTVGSAPLLEACCAACCLRAFDGPEHVQAAMAELLRGALEKEGRL